MATNSLTLFLIGTRLYIPSSPVSGWDGNASINRVKVIILGEFQGQRKSGSLPWFF